MPRLEELIQKLLESDLSHPERAELDQLLQHDANAELTLLQHLEIEALLRSLNNTFDVSTPVMARVRTSQTPEKSTQNPLRRLTSTLGNHPWRVAAALALTATLTAATLYALRPAPGPTMTLSEGLIDPASNAQKTTPGRAVSLAGLDHISLPKNANAAIAFRNGVKVDLGLEADMTFLRTPGETPDTARSIRMAAGRIAVEAPTGPAGSEFTIETPHGQTRFVGARVAMFTSPRATQVSVESGLATVTQRSEERPLQLHQGQYAILREGVTAAPLPILPTRCLFDEQADPLAFWTAEAGLHAIIHNDSRAGSNSLKLTPQQGRVSLAGMCFPIREHPKPGEYRFVSFAWRKEGGGRVGLQFDHADEAQDRSKKGRAAGYRFDAGPGPQVDDLALRLDGKTPSAWWLVTRDLWQDFGDFTLTGLTFLCPDGTSAGFDSIYVGRTPADLAVAMKVPETPVYFAAVTNDPIPTSAQQLLGLPKFFR